MAWMECNLMDQLASAKKVEEISIKEVMVGREGFEPPTDWFEASNSIQLS